MSYYVTLGCFLYPLLSSAMSCYARLCLAMLREVMRCSAKNVYAMLRYAMLGMAMLLRLNVCSIKLWYGRRMVMLYSVMVFYVGGNGLIWYTMACYMMLCAGNAMTRYVLQKLCYAMIGMAWQCHAMVGLALFHAMLTMLCQECSCSAVSSYARRA